MYTKTVAEEVATGSASATPSGQGPLFDRAPSPDVYTRTVADAQALLPSYKDGPAVPHAIASAPGRPSDILPRAPSPAESPSAAVPPAFAVMPSAYALPDGQSGPAYRPTLAYPSSPAREDGRAPQAKDNDQLSPPSAAGYPPAAGYPHMAAPPGGYLHTPPPPGGFGAPPDLNDASYPMAALDSLEGLDRSPEAPNPVWRQAHPSATRWAATRTGRPAITSRPGIIALGLMLAGLGAYLLLIFLPSKAPLTAAVKAEQMQQAGVDVNAWHFTVKLLTMANINAGLFALLGVVVLLQGALHRQGPTRRKSMSKTSLLLLACFGLLGVSFIALLLTASMR